MEANSPSIIESIQAQVIEKPDATAICASDGDLTYAQLETTSTQLAIHLRSLGVGADVMVPLLFNRCQWVVVAQLAVLKAGGAFVPLDPVHPDAYLTNIIGRVKSTVILTSEIYADRASMLGEKIVCVGHSLISELPNDDNIGLHLLPTPQPNTPAYVLFTSGSTGQPKGCVIQHKAMAQISNQIAIQSIDLSASSRVLQFTSYGFAVSIVEIYYGLCVGATICIPSDHDRMNNLTGAMEEMKVTWSIMTPSLLRTLEPHQKPTNLQTILLAGEPIIKGEFDGWDAIVDLVQVYGASENCGLIGFTNPQLDVMAFHPFPNFRFWIVEATDHHSLAPAGTVGELILEGPSLARGYLNDPLTTSSAFVDTTVWRQSKVVPGNAPRNLYKTGDLFCYSQYGGIRYAGRTALDVKIRGKRIDLKEVEYNVRQCCVDATRAIAVTAPPADANQVAVLVVFLHSPRYISAKGENSEAIFAASSEAFQSEVHTIQAKLVETMPDHMLPTFYIPLAFIPMTVTGKVDMSILRNCVQKATRAELEAYQSSAVVEMVQPATETEKCLHDVFSQVLGVNGSSFGVHHSFIRLGGDSLSAMRVVALCQSRNYPEVTVAEILGQQTIRKLAQNLDISTERKSSSMVPPPIFSLLPGVDQDKKDAVVKYTAEKCSVSIDAIQDIYPCTALQEGLMVSTIKAQDMYIARCIFDLSSGTDLEQLKAAWQTTVDANVMLRTRIVQSPSDGMIQAVLCQDQSIIQWASFSSIGEYHNEDRASSMGPGEPLARFSLIGDPSSGLSLALTLHHAIFDRYSLGLLLTQAHRAYSGEVLEPNIFSPFIQTIQRQDNLAGHEFWKDIFADLQAPTFPSLPHDMALPMATAHLEQTVTLPLQMDSGITLSNIARLAWAIVVSVHADSADVTFGVTVNGRATPTPGVEEMAGPTIATVPFRVRCNQEDTVADALAAIQSLAIRMIAYEQTGLQNIRQISPEAASACEFQSQLVFQQPEQSPTDQDSQIMKGRTAQHGMEDLSVFINYAIGLVCTPSAGNQSLHLDVYFDRNILPEAMANRLVTQFANILQQLCANQNQRIDQLDLVSPQDLAVMIKRNGISLPMEYPGTLHGLILQNAQDEPLAPAVSSWDKSLTYQDLEALSNNLGHEIIQAGVKPGDRVALCFEKSIWPVLSMLSVLRAGAIGVNIDPSLPPVRIAAILQVAEPSLVLTSAGTHPIVQSVQSRIPIMEISSRTQSTEPTAETKKVVEWPSVKPDDVAFIIFTSGTTGTPKGIVIEHRHFTTALHYHRDTMGAYPGMRALHFCSYAWDMGVHEVFYTWVHGGCLCIPSETQRMSNLAGFIREHRVNWALMTPSASTILNPDEVPGLTTLLVGGELIPIELMETWSSRLRMINLYGQAETLMVCATGQIEPSSVHCPGRVGPLMGTAGWITTPGDVSRLAPLGTIGELLLEGPMVSRGYFNEPEKTRQAFIEAPAWLRKVRPDGSTGRIYRTGDLAWFDDDGILHFVGRKDTQVKLRGQRIILSDIQHQIQLHFASAQQVVAEVIRPQHSTSALLVAFIYQGSTEDNGDKSQILQDPDEVFLQHSASVIATLQDSLPAHMIPTAMFPIHYVPYGATLKIDRRKLREQAEQLTPDRLQSYAMGENSRDTQKEPPKTSSEVMWQGLWAQVLSIPVDRIGRDDHLFRMGGDSLMAIKLVALAHREGLPHITFQDVFEHPRLRDIAAVSTVSSSISASPQDSPGPAPFALVQDVDILIQMASDQCHISVDTIEDIYPCTPLQSSLIASTVHHRDAYMLLQSYTLSDGVNAERLEKAWESTAETHPILRTRIFQTPAGTSYQAVLRGPLEWSHLEADDSTPSHPIVGLGTPLIKLILSPRRLLLSIHHAVYDGWSLNLLASQVEKTYNDLSAQSPALFNRFIQHVEGSMDSAALFWRNELQDADPVQFPALPSLNFQPNPQSTIDKIITLPENTKQDNATLASKIKLAWALVSSTYSKNNDVIVGVVSSGRTAPVADIDRIMGPTIATVPLRVRLDPRKKVCEALEQLQAKFAEQAPYEHFGLQQISQQGDNAAAACQFQTLIAVEPKQPKDQFSSEKQAWYRDAKILSDTTHFSSHALMLQCETLPGGSTIELTATFDADVLPVGQMQRVLSQFEYFLMQVQDVSDTTATTIGDLQVVSPQDLEELMRWNSLPSLADDYVDSCVHELVHRQCQRQPDAQAIHAWDGDFTYKELDDHSTRLASHIQALALVRPDTFVALYFEKSRWTVVAQLAVLKAGGAFTMFDPSHPLQRLQEICSTIQPPLILTSEDQKEYAAGAFHVPVVGVGHALVREGSLCLDCDGSIVMPNNAMYAISTSGTTGKPKVVVIEHRCFVANRDPMIEMLGLTPYSRVFQFSGYSFDAMLVEHFATLLAGGCICIPSKFDRDNFLEKAITEMRANWAVLTTSVIQLLSPSTVPTIKTLVQAGEPMNQSIIDRWASHVRLGNAYGPAENTIFTCASIDIEPDANPNVIGQAKGCATWIVDPATLDLVPIGAEGELIIEGETVGRGYLNDPERTAAAFTSKPSWLKQLRGCVSDKPVYRTGDLVKYTPDGSICYVRRKDLQIKLRGQRLELADVEHHVQRCFPGALQVVATVISLNNSNPAVVALVLSSSAPVQPAADNDLLLPATSNGGFLKAAQTAELALHERVPAYMIPKVFLPLSRIPRNINGKVDRHQIDVRLASLTRQEVDSYNASSNVIVPPENDLQNEIRAIWAVVLSIAPEEIGIRNSFFRIGGDSITSMQVVAQCRTSRILITMQDLFKHRTIEELAAHVSQSNPKDAAEVDQPEQFEIFDKEMDLSPIQQMYFDSAPKNPNHFVQSLILRLERNDLDAESIARALDTVVHTHSMLRARFKKSPDGKWTQSIPANGNGKHYRYHDCGIQSQEEIEIICHSRQQTLDIQNGPLFVVDQFERDNDGTHWLNLMAHHLIVDLVSWRVILADLEQILTTGSAPKVPPTPFLHWCQLQADYATSSLPAVLDKDDQDFTAYWGDEATNHNTHQDVDTYTISLDQETSRVLLGSANEPLGTQPVEIIQAAVLHSFVQLFPDRSAPVIFSEGHGREPWDPTIDITRTVGWFTTIWPTQVDLQVSEGMVTALRRTKDARRNTPANGWEYFTSCYLHPQGPKTKKTMEIILNYQGRYQQLERADALFKFDGTNKFGAGNEVEDMPRFSLLDVSAQVTDDSLHLQFIINRRMKHQDRLKQWAGQCAQSLREASAQLSTMQGRHPTVSDFPLLTNVQSDQLHGALTDLSLKLDGQEIEAIYPTSPIQRGILMSQARNTHHYQQVIRWKVLSTDPAAGVPVQIEELGRAWQRVVNRHPALRTVFLEITDGVIDQVVLKNVSAAIQWDFTLLEPNNDRICPSSVLHLETSTQGEITLNLHMNHALFDGPSERILRRELALAYGNDNPMLPATSYQDYVAYLCSVTAAGNDDEVYWRGYLDSSSPCLFPRLLGDAHSDQNQEAIEEFGSFLIDVGSTTAVEDFCEEHRIALTSVYHVVWAIVLSCYTGATNICFGYISSGRSAPVPGIQEIVGPVINLLIGQLQLEQEAPLMSVLQQYHESRLNSLEHQHHSLGETLNAIGASSSELFNTAISIQDRRKGVSDSEPLSTIALIEGDGEDRSEVTICFG
jgi:amino acid adenylation domain-containing protein/non-ribosomal peptide synthase protein (TIGR01720 family)